MDHRYSRRFATRAVAVICHHTMPVAIGVVVNCNRTGVYIQTSYQPGDHEHCIDFELTLNRDGRTWRQALRGLIVHRDANGMGLMVEAEEFSEALELLRPRLPEQAVPDRVALPFQ
ncbi:MAG: hypothetical protein CMN57_10220 [Gammaproteobacteria bacterium]|nr:hypothetical protein [Gammaproteobacteria bacterium]